MQFDKSKGLVETLISEMPGPRGELLEHTNSRFMFQGEGVPVKEIVNRENFVQNREEFLVDVHQDRANAKIAVRFPVTGRNDESGVGIYQQCYEDLTTNLSLRNMDSGCSSHVLDFDSAMGSMENGVYFNNNCGIPGKDTTFGQGLTKAPTVNGFDQANASLGVQHLAEDSASLQGLKKSSNVNQSSASAPNLTELEFAQSSSHSHNEISGRLQPKKVKFLCGFGGKILPRPSDGKLRYVGGETRMVTIRINITWAELVQKTSELCNQPHTIKYQLPGEELDALISVSSDEDLQNMIEECYSGEKLGSSQRLRIFLIPLIESDDLSAIDTSDVQQSDPDYQYVVAVNGVTRVDSNLSENSNEKAMETDLNHLTSTLNRNTSFQENTLSSWNPSQSVNILNGLTPLMNGPQDTISPAIQCAPLPPVTIQQRDLKNGFSLLHKAKLSPESSECLPLFNTVASPPEIYSNHVPSSHNFPTLGGTSNGNKNDALGVQVSQMNSPATQILPMPILELRGHNMQECSSARPVVEERVLHLDKPFPFPDDTMNVFCESNNSIPANHGMPHAFSDSKLQEYGGSSTYSSQEGINQYFSLNFPKPPLFVSADLLEKPVQPFQQNEDVGFSNPYLKSKISSAEQVFNNQGPNFINFSFDSELDEDTEPVPWDISINREDLQSVISASHEHSCIIKEQEENCSNSELIDDTVKQFDDKNSTAGALETLDFYVDRTFYVGNNNQQQSIHESRELEPPSICLKPSKEKLVNKQLLLTESPRGVPGSNKSNINHLETAEIVNNGAQTSSDVNLVTDLLSGLCSSLVSLESSGQQPFSCSNHMGMENFILTNCTLPPSSAVIETDKVCQNAYVRREYSLIDDDWSGNNNGIQRLEPQDNCTGNLQNSSVVALDELKVPMSTSYSRTTQHTVDVVRAAYPSPSTIEAERTLEELLSADEHFEDGSKNGQITDATKAEKEAEEYGLQIIKNSDLEDLRELGSGTYGTVYHGRWKGTDVAIKRIRKTCFSGRLSQQERLTKDFWKEALVLSKLHHPNIVAFYGAVPDGAGGTLATVTEYMSHGSLRSVLVKKDRFLDYRRKLRITMDSAIGMEYLHSRNIIHFDLKCDNLLVSLTDPERPVCKVGDFGLSKIKQNTLVSGGVRGSLPWMAPELLSGSTDLVSDKVDVFSFGISMWEILTGEEPYKNMHCGLIIGGIIKNTLRPPIPERCDPEWRKLMQQCWSINPEERPSFTEISNRLRSMYAVLEAKGKSNQQTKA